MDWKKIMLILSLEPQVTVSFFNLFKDFYFFIFPVAHPFLKKFNGPKGSYYLLQKRSLNV
ncbi:hypothetical protein LCGC14_1527770 [marine sediment metagenome]|uniref:Uncharacterized protein n=1 Tax=marine sediment metagenome TaxID=412755 RepID=A0A0F9JHN2_9ZZZZ